MARLFAVSLILLAALPACAEPAGERQAQADRDQAGWADLEAQSRIADGDYEGAVQAERQAETERHAADRESMSQRSSGSGQ